MNRYSIQQIESILGVPRHRIDYAIRCFHLCGSLPRVGTNRIFDEKDLQKLIRHFARKSDVSPMASIEK